MNQIIESVKTGVNKFCNQLKHRKQSKQIIESVHLLL